jgi:tRNA G26 N,N-dimethylase Trm1
MVLVFKTSVTTKDEVHHLAPLLDHAVGSRWNFDLDDCDKVLRIERPLSDSKTVIDLLRQQGYECAELKD